MQWGWFSGNRMSQTGHALFIIFATTCQHLHGFVDWRTILCTFIPFIVTFNALMVLET